MNREETGTEDNWSHPLVLPSPVPQPPPQPPLPLVLCTGLFMLRVLETASHLIFFMNLETHVAAVPFRDKEMEVEKI